MRAILVTSLLAASLAAVGMSGCTIYGEKKPPTLQSTTSAEQYERIFWSSVKAKNWQPVPGLLAANVMYNVAGKVLSKDQVVPYLQGANIADFNISGYGGQAERSGYDAQLHLATFARRWPGPDLHRDQCLATGGQGLDPHCPYRTTPNRGELGIGCPVYEPTERSPGGSGPTSPVERQNQYDQGRDDIKAIFP